MPAKPIKFSLNGKDIDLSNTLPLTIGDIKAMKKDGIDMMKVDTDNMDLDQIVNLLLWVCKKANPEITADDIERMSLPMMTRLSKRMAEAEDDLPF